MDDSPACWRKDRAALRRAQVLAAARDCFRRHGFHDATMARIAEAAGLSVGQIYRHFPSKEAVTAAIVDESGCEKMAHIAAIEAAALASGGDLAGAGLAQAEQPPEAAERQDTALMLEIIAQAARNPALAEIMRRHDERLRDRCEQMLAATRPGWSKARIRATVTVIGALYEGFDHRLVVDPAGVDPAAFRLRAALIAAALGDEPLEDAPP